MITPMGTLQSFLRGFRRLLANIQLSIQTLEGELVLNDKLITQSALTSGENYKRWPWVTILIKATTSSFITKKKCRGGGRKRNVGGKKWKEREGEKGREREKKIGKPKPSIGHVTDQTNNSRLSSGDPIARKLSSLWKGSTSECHNRKKPQTPCSLFNSLDT